MRILVCGSRDWRNYQRIARHLWQQHQRLQDLDIQELTIIEGGADGADRCAARWVNTMTTLYGVPGIAHEPYPADWPNCAPECNPAHRKVNARGEEYCPTAGHRRNQRMIDEGKPDMVFAFKTREDSRGTNDMVERAEKAGIPVNIVLDQKLRVVQ